PGVAEVASVGGYVKQYQVNVDPNKLLGYGVTLDDVTRAVRASNQEVGGRVIEIAGHEQVIRGRGYVKKPEDIGLSPLKVVNGTAVRVQDVAQVSIGPDIRRGVTELNGEGEAPGGIVILRYGENALNVIARVKERLQEVKRGLPQGVEVIVTYDRSELIEEAVSTLRHTLIEEMVVVSVVIFVFLLHVRSALIPILTLPIGVLLSFIPMLEQRLLSQVVTIRSVLGPPMIRSEGGKLVGFVFVDTERPIADYVAEAKAVVARDVVLPAGTRLEWVGQFKYFERAKERLEWVIPLTLGIVILLLYFNTQSAAETVIVMLAVPFSLVGAIWLLNLLNYSMSVAVWVGLIALAGLDAETGVVMLLYLKLAHARRERDGTLKTRADLRETIVDGAAKRLRPKLMTVATMIIGLVPVLWSNGAGADVMKRIAAPMIGGLVTSFLLELSVYPAIFAIWKGRGLPESGPS
ncbi:MAG: efflux RND transporter permease subunit, partial [Deltaproteobacteria bacterium]